MKPPVSARDYHRATRHTYWSVRTGGFFLDWTTQPAVYRRFLDVPRLDLETDFRIPMPSTARALARMARVETATVPPLDRRLLAQWLYCAYGLTAKKIYPGGHSFLRAAPSSGALYPVEVFLLSRGVSDLPDGLYHFSVGDFSLYRLREGDWRRPLSNACGNDARVASAPLVFVLTAIVWRTAWKYRDRSYRYVLLDTGHVAGNVLAVGAGLGFNTALLTSFVDPAVARLLGVDGDREIPTAVLPAGFEAQGVPPGEAPGAGESPPELRLRDDSGFRGVVTYDWITRIHRASVLEDPEAVRAQREAAARFAGVSRDPQGTEIPLPRGEGLAFQGLRETLFSRRSSRDFHSRPVPLETLGAVLWAAGQGLVADFLSPRQRSLLHPYLIVNAVEGLPQGVYAYLRDRHALVRLRTGDFRERAGYLCLEQELCSHGAVVFFITVDLEAVEAAFGPRGYRHAYVEAGLWGENLYLAGRALGVGASGIGAFYDDEVDAFLGLKDTGRTVLYAFVMGLEQEDARLA